MNKRGTRFKFLPIVLFLTAVFLLVLVFLTRHDKGDPPSSPVGMVASNDWQPNEDVLVLRLWQPGRSAGIYARRNIIPQMQIWGNGRIIWLANGSPYYQRQVREAVLTRNEMTRLYQHIMASGFESWAERYDKSAEPLAGTYLAIDLDTATLEPRRTYIEGETPAQFQALFAFLNALPTFAHAPQPYQPVVGELYVHGAGFSVSADTRQWPEDAPALHDGGEIILSGDTLLFTWDLINENPTAPLTVQHEEVGYMVSLAIPGVSFCSEQRTIVMDFC